MAAPEIERACFLLQAKSERLEEYIKTHDPVWPEMVQALRDVGIRNYSLFYREDGLLVGYLEGEDIKASLAKLGKTDVNRRWQELMAPYFEEGSGDMETGALHWLRQYFHME